MTDMLNVALSVVRELGLPVFPCRETLDEKGKIRKSPYTKNGYKAASKNEEQIRLWWRNFPDALVGVPAGPITGILVVDIDQSIACSKCFCASAERLRSLFSIDEISEATDCDRPVNASIF